jgi:hypothetical protein
VDAATAAQCLFKYISQLERGKNGKLDIEWTPTSNIWILFVLTFKRQTKGNGRSTTEAGK